MNDIMRELSVIDFFCGAGGFSEGFKQQGFKIILGIDNSESAIRTFEKNFLTKGLKKNILDYENSVEEIEKLPDTDVIIGSPPCVSFSSSNRSGKADKSIGIRLTEVFLRIVAVKKNKPNSNLKVWLMENVVNSKRYLKDKYTFKDLGLIKWAKANGFKPSNIALNLTENSALINSADYGSPQLRKRLISGEFIVKGKLIVPPKTHSENGLNGLQKYVMLKQIKDSLTDPYSKNMKSIITDPLYPNLKIVRDELTDHFYDTGLFECEWRQSRFYKVNHPYMGKMAFPENENKPSRTITATKIGTSRESIIYRCEMDRVGNGQYRIPTVREIACLMGFPINFQFYGGLTSKWRLVGNAVCPSVSNAFAKIIRSELKLEKIKNPVLEREIEFSGLINLNDYKVKQFGKPPKRNKGARFRRHPFKDGNMTITLSNYDISKGEKQISKWQTSIQYGNGEGFPNYKVPENYFKKIESIISETKKGKQFLEIVNNGFIGRIGDSKALQEMYELQKPLNDLIEPTELTEEVDRIIELLDVGNEIYSQNYKKITVFKNKDAVPLKQLFALYAINKISSIVNRK